MRAFLKSSVGVAALALLATAAMGAGTDWPMSGQDLGANRYVSLMQITPSNVQNLQKAWTYHLKPANSVADAPAHVPGHSAGDRQYHVHRLALWPSDRAGCDHRRG